METWIAITIAAAFLQNLRSAGQKHLKSKMGTIAATFVRFGFGLPFALVYMALLHFGFGFELPSISGNFLLWVVLGSFAQISAQLLLIHMFSYRNFAVGTAYSRTEPAQAALFGLIFLSEFVNAATLAAIAICVFGVMLISVAHVKVTPRSLITSLFQRSTLIGLASGAFFGIAAVAFRGASLSLGGPNFVTQAAFTLMISIAFQAALMLVWLAWRERGELTRIAIAWKPSLFVGAVGATASFGWFAAMTLQQAAVVKALAQVEMLFAMVAAVFFFKEKITRLELAGCLLIVAGIIVLVVLN